MRKKIIIIFSLIIIMSGGIFLATHKENKKLSQRKVTNSQIAIGNLNSQLGTLSRISQAKFSTAKYRLQLMNLMLMKMQFLGNYEEFHSAQELLFQEPKSEDEYLLNINFYMATHQFSKAGELIKKLSPEKRKRKEVSLNLAKGESIEETHNYFKTYLKSNRTFSNLLTMANLKTELGYYNEADLLYDEALKNYKNTSPFPVALAYFQKGVLWGEKASDPEKALLNYEKAVHFLPEYSSAQIHLAELYLEQGKTEKALSGVLKVLNNGDPEVKSTLAEIYYELGNQEKFSSYNLEASTEYQQFLKSFEAAFTDHAAEFYMSHGGDSQLAMNLAKKNLNNRKSQRAYLLALEASTLAKNTTELCSIVHEIDSQKVTHTDLKIIWQKSKKNCSIN